MKVRCRDIIGALAGYPLIKQAMNQGYEVVETILGNDILPADHALLAAKVAAITGERPGRRHAVGDPTDDSQSFPRLTHCLPRADAGF